MVRNALRSFLVKHETLIVILLCIFAGLRVMLFSAAFPFFNNVDESSHFDVVYHYSQGDCFQKFRAYHPESCTYMVFYFSPEYMANSADFTAGRIRPPLWKLPVESTQKYINKATAYWQTTWNTESTHPPVYYLAAGAWFRLGQMLGLEGGNLLYWVRFLNIVIIMLLAWLSYAFMREFFTTSLFMRIGAPLMLVFFPQDTFYAITNDVATPLLFGAAFFLMLKVYRSDSPGYLLSAMTGLLTAGAFLTKFSNAAIYAVLVIVAAARMMTSKRAGSLKNDIPRLMVLAAAASLPVILVFARNYYVLGDVVGTSETIKHMGWTYKPLREVFNNPIFSITGAASLINELTTSFWRGEFVWHSERMASTVADGFYVSSSIILIIVSTITAFARRTKEQPGERTVLKMSVCAVALCVLSLMGLSVILDYGSWFYPSQEHPYFASGRLVSGAILPFLALYLYGIRRILPGSRLMWARTAVLAVTCLVMAVSEIWLSRDVFYSEFNWYHF